MIAARSAHLLSTVFLFCAALCVAAGAPGSAWAQAKADQAIAGDTTSTRLVILLEKAVTPQLQSLTNPNRVIIDFDAANASYPVIDKPVGLVRSITGGVSGVNRFRVIVSLAEPVIIEPPKLERSADGKSHRLVLDFVPASSLNLASLKQAPAHGKILPNTQQIVPPMPRPAERPDVLAKRNAKDLIVIDPGHGGYDTGATRNSTVEKDVVLAFSKVLKTRLEATGRYRVLMTRETDVFIPLDDRRAFAEKNKASLFIAVHADDAQSGARGATIYSLRDAVATSLRRSAKGSSSDDLVSAEELARAERGSQGDVKGILADLAVRDFDATQERSSFFSKSVIETMSETTNMHGNPEREAAFRVLKTARLPSVLIELAFVSNEQDAKLLRSDDWRRKVADSIVSAVDNYFSHQLARLPM